MTDPDISALTRGQFTANRGPRAEAEDRFRRSAEAGHAEGANNYAVLLYQRDAALREVFRWFQLAAEGGIPDAISNMAKIRAALE